MKVKDILKLKWSEINRMSEKELRKITTQLVSAGNKRLKRIEKAGLQTESQAYLDTMLLKTTIDKKGQEKITGGKFSVKDKKRTQLLSEFKRITNFLKSKTGNIRGIKKEVEKRKKLTEQEIKSERYNKIVKGVTDDQLKMLWRVFNKVKELKPNIFSSSYKYDVAYNINEMVKGYNLENVDKIVKDDLSDKLTFAAADIAEQLYKFEIKKLTIDGDSFDDMF